MALMPNHLFFMGQLAYLSNNKIVSFKKKLFRKACVCTYVHLQSEGGLACPGGDKGEEEVDY